MIDFSGLNDFVIGGKLFQHKEMHNLTLYSPTGRDRNQIDYILINGRWRHSIQEVKVRS